MSLRTMNRTIHLQDTSMTYVLIISVPGAIWREHESRQSAQGSPLWILFRLEGNLGGLQCKARVNKWGVCVRACVHQNAVISKTKEESLSLSIENFI